jgi:DNA-binding transcriptional LysR family regulator
MDRLESMSVLLTVTETGSLTAAARALGTPLTTVSRKISALEKHLKTQLFTRAGRRVTLTDSGRSYVGASRRILQDVSEAERAASGEYSAPRGELIVTAPIVFGRLHVLPIVTDFLKSYPEIDIRLVLADRLFNLAEERVDLAIRIGALPNSSLKAKRVGSIRQVVCGSPTYFEEHGEPNSPIELTDHSCISFDGLMAPDTWMFAVNGSEKPIAIHSRLVVNTAEAAVDAAIAGIGITRVLSYQVEQATMAGKLQIALKAFEPKPWPINLVYSGGELMPLKLRAFLDFAAPRFKIHLPQIG